MAREFSKVSPLLWRSNRFRQLGADDAKLLYLFLMTCDHQTSAGGFRLPDAYAVADLGWTMERLASARAALVEGDFVAHDEATEEYFIHRWFRHNPPMNRKHRIGVEKAIEKIDSERIREAASHDLETEAGDASAEDGGEAQGSISSRLVSTAFMSGRRSRSAAA